MLSISKHQLQEFIGCLKMSTNDEPKESEYTYYAITPIRYIGHPEKPLVRIAGHFSLIKEEKPNRKWYKLEVLTGTNNRNFYSDLEEIIASNGTRKQNFSKHTFLKRIVKIPYDNMLLELGTFIQIHEKYKCNAYKLKEEHEFMKININN